MSLCARCHYQQPFAPGEDFCRDCEVEVQEILEMLTERGMTNEGDIGPPTGAPQTVARRTPRSVSVLDQPGPFYFRCEPCSCGGNCEKCR